MLPIEINQEYRGFNFGMEVGHWFSQNSDEGNILGMAIVRQVTSSLELLGEFYNTWTEAEGRDSTLGIGGRYELHHGLLLLFMAGHGIPNLSDEPQPEWIGYLGLQFQFGRKQAN